jgi:heme oxygenase (mycobilin-producing)
MPAPSVYRVLLRMQVVPGREESFERAWRASAQAIADEPANLAQWLSRGDDGTAVYYIVSDWLDEPSFRAYEGSERHRRHRERLHPYRSSGSMTTMTVVAATGSGAGT